MSEREPNTRPESAQQERMEFSFLLIKPNAVKTGMTGILRQELIEAGFDIVTEQSTRISRYGAEVFYSSLGEKKEPVIEHIVSGDSHVFVVYGLGTIKRLRDLQGHTAWKDRPAKGLRGKYAFDHIQNSVHCPDSYRESVVELNEVFSDIRDKMLKSQLADEVVEFLNNTEAIENGEKYLSTYAI